MKTTRTSLSIDSELLKMASNRAKEDKTSVSSVMRILLLDYAIGEIKIGARVNPKIRGEIIKVDRITRDLMNGVLKKWNEKSKK